MQGPSFVKNRPPDLHKHPRTLQQSFPCCSEAPSVFDKRRKKKVGKAPSSMEAPPSRRHCPRFLPKPSPVRGEPPPSLNEAPPKLQEPPPVFGGPSPENCDTSC